MFTRSRSSSAASAYCSSSGIGGCGSQGRATSHGRGQPPTTATADEMRPLLGSPTSGGGLTGLQASLDKQLDDLRSKWDTLFRQKEASSNAGGLSDEQRRRAQEELQRALGGF